MTWEEKHEKQEQKLVGELFEYLAKHDAANIERAASHAHLSVKEHFKEFGKGLVRGVVPGLGLGVGIGKSMEKMLTSAYGGAMLRSKGCKASADGGDPLQPYNYLANLFAAVLTKKATVEERKLFARWYISLAAMVGGTVGGVALGPVIGEGAAHVVEMGLDQGADLFIDEIVENLASDGKLKELKVGPVAWAIYLSAVPRHPRAPTSTVENCRLALRVILGLPIDRTSYKDGGDARFMTHPERNKPVVTPADSCLLLSKHPDYAENVMIKGDVTKNFAKLASFNDLGEVHDDYNFAHPPPTAELMKFHITYLQFILVGLGLKKCLDNDKFELT